MSNPIMEIINETATNIHSSADDYVKDGILYCGKCNTPKQVYIEYFGKAMPTPCKCRQEQLQKEKEREEKMKKALKIKELREASLLGKRFENASFDNTETAHSAEFKTVYDRCKRYCEIADDVLINGIGIYLFGTNGTGKSRLTACMGNELMNNGYSCHPQIQFEIEIAKRIWNNRDCWIVCDNENRLFFTESVPKAHVTYIEKDYARHLQSKVIEILDRIL